MSDYKPQQEILKLCAGLNLHKVAHIMVVDNEGTYTIHAGIKNSDPDLMLLLTLLQVYFRHQDDMEMFAELTGIVAKYGTEEDMVNMSKDMHVPPATPARKEDIN